MIKLRSHYSSLHHIDSDQPQLPDLKPLIAPWTPERIRRIDRYIELCVAGGLNCVGNRGVPARTGVYLATRYGAVSTSAKVMETIIAEGEMPKPLHFVNTLGNSACFYLTRLLHTTGHTLVISQEQFSFEAALFHAWLDLQQGNIEAALVGGIDEMALPLAHQAERWGVSAGGVFTEGTHWLLLDKKDTIDAGGNLWLEQPVYCSDLDSLEAALGAFPHHSLSVNSPLPADEAARLTALRPSLSLYLDEGAHHHGVYSGALLLDVCAQLLVRRTPGLYLARNNEGQYFLQPIGFME